MYAFIKKYVNAEAGIINIGINDIKFLKNPSSIRRYPTPKFVNLMLNQKQFPKPNTNEK